MEKIICMDCIQHGGVEKYGSLSSSVFSSHVTEYFCHNFLGNEN